MVRKPSHLAWVGRETHEGQGLRAPTYALLSLPSELHMLQETVLACLAELGQTQSTLTRVPTNQICPSPGAGPDDTPTTTISTSSTAGCKTLPGRGKKRGLGTQEPLT